MGRVINPRLAAAVGVKLGNVISPFVARTLQRLENGEARAEELEAVLAAPRRSIADVESEMEALGVCSRDRSAKAAATTPVGQAGYGRAVRAIDSTFSDLRAALDRLR